MTIEENAHTPPTIEVKTLVVGSGPSGFAAAYYAAPAGKVLIIDKFTLPRDKSCGGMIHPLSQEILKDIAPVPEWMLLDPSSVYFRYNDWDKGRIRNTDLAFLNVDRAPFDEWLLQQLPDGVEVMDSTRYISHAPRPDGRLDVVAQKGDEQFAIICDFLVGADGTRSSVRKSLGLNDFEKYVTLQDFCILEGPIAPAFDCFWFDAIPELGVGYVIPKSERVLVGLIYYPGTKKAHELQDRALEILRERLPIGETIKREAWAALKHSDINDISPGIGRVLLTGEAGGYLSPTSGEGISWALDSGRAAGRAIAQDLGDETLAAYAAGVEHLRRDIARRLWVFPIMNSRWGKTLMGYVPRTVISKATHYL
ncbi:MAG: FAD-dependent monooxygenase [Actinomycetia bacterium]|nr:FAD-dependent monooxygenase [Actinomycetes bacterium]